ncbi:MAG: hypothetical protein ACREPD_21505 [Stenotrophomonas sp.]|uniref:hypothetical protein n=1 Tax=Gammaproteobacteria TaxID=1236 RepID=UPI003D6D5CAF
MTAQEDFQALESAADAALRITLEHVMQLSSPQVVPYLTNVVAIGVELLRAGGTEDAFVHAFLSSALDSLDAPPALSMKDFRRN